MKIRVIKKLVDGVFDVRVYTEAWSEYDRELMVKYGEPEINVGGTIVYETTEEDASTPEYELLKLDDAYARVMTESPFTRKFDSKDFSYDIDLAKSAATAWANATENKIATKVQNLRNKDTFFTTEEITEY